MFAQNKTMNYKRKDFNKMEIVIFLTSIYACIETAITGYLEYKENNNKCVGIFLYILAVFCLIVPNFVV